MHGSRPSAARRRSAVSGKIPVLAVSLIVSIFGICSFVVISCPFVKQNFWAEDAIPCKKSWQVSIFDVVWWCKIDRCIASSGKGTAIPLLLFSFALDLIITQRNHSVKSRQFCKKSIYSRHNILCSPPSKASSRLLIVNAAAKIKVIFHWKKWPFVLYYII